MKLPSRPSSIRDSQHFFRHHGNSQMRLMGESDEIRSVLKGVNMDGMRVVWQLVVELPLSDRDLYEQRFIVAAQSAHKFLCTLKSLDKETEP